MHKNKDRYANHYIKMEKSPDSDIIIRRPYTLEEFEEYLDLRYRVLRKPLGGEKGSELNKNLLYEYAGHHIAAIDKKTGKVIGGVVGYVENNISRIRYMCVEEAYRMHGIGKKMMQKLEHKLAKYGAKKIVLYARENVVGFYDKLGYKVMKKYTKEEALKELGILVAHSYMEKIITS